MSVSGIGSAATTTQPNSATSSKALSAQSQAQVAALQKRDTEVRTHEQAHERAGGRYAGAPSFTYQQGPDGKQYAVGGEVKIDASAIPNDPAATAAKMRVVQRAALAPAQPSGQDLHVAAEAAAALAQAQQEESKATVAAATGASANKNGQAATNFAAQQIGSAQTGQTGQAGQTGAGPTSAAAVTATAAAAQSGGVTGLLTRAVTAYTAAANLGGSQSSSQLAAVA